MPRLRVPAKFVHCCLHFVDLAAQVSKIMRLLLVTLMRTFLSIIALYGGGIHFIVWASAIMTIQNTKFKENLGHYVSELKIRSN